MKLRYIYWIAALLEGEGNFNHKTSPQIRVGMTDLDVIEQFRKLTKTERLKISVQVRDRKKPLYVTHINSDLAIQWMMTIYSLMGVRRRDEIKRVINKWKEGGIVLEPEKTNYRGKKYNEMVKALMIAKQISKEEATKLASEMLFGTVQ